MSDRRPATTIGELDIHLGFLMEELKEVRSTLDQLATKEWVSAKIYDIETKIEANSPKSIWKRSTELAVGFVAVSAAFALAVKIIKWMGI